MDLLTIVVSLLVLFVLYALKRYLESAWGDRASSKSRSEGLGVAAEIPGPPKNPKHRTNQPEIASAGGLRGFLPRLHAEHGPVALFHWSRFLPVISIFPAADYLAAFSSHSSRSEDLFEHLTPALGSNTLLSLPYVSAQPVRDAILSARLPDAIPSLLLPCNPGDARENGSEKNKEKCAETPELSSLEFAVAAICLSLGVPHCTASDASALAHWLREASRFCESRLREEPSVDSLSSWDRAQQRAQEVLARGEVAFPHLRDALWFALPLSRWMDADGSEDSLRSVCPVEMAARRAEVDVRIREVLVPKDVDVVLPIAALADSDAREYYPFGFGVRKCPGEALARQIVALYQTYRAKNPLKQDL